eukprot:TRINITY_DN8064_c0_g1_i1.p2 TRINITY_DN8064_c0_g1~~TRINITY_DN8064_c0_g1_i1.p2  ORF type:complete len:365 (+),score=71.29 TRINITY_DN8064_c0_g1_i1:2873-3967(+)
MVFVVSASRWVAYCTRQSPCRADVTRKLRFATSSCSPKDLRVLFLGSDDFALHTLSALHQNKDNYAISKLEVVAPAHPEKARKRQYCAPRRYCEEHDVKVYDAQPREALNELSSNFDIGVVVSFGQLLPETFINGFTKGCINVHPSLLPRYRGAAPIHHTLLNGDTVTGVSLIQLSVGRFDQGSILDQRAHLVQPDDNFPTLSNSLGQLGAQMVLDALEDFDAKMDNAKEQDTFTHKVSKAPKPKKVQRLIDPQNHTAVQAVNAFRALGYKGMPIKLNTVQVMLADVELGPDLADRKPGSYLVEGDAIVVAMQDGSSLKLKTLSHEKTGTLTGAAMLERFKLKPNSFKAMIKVGSLDQAKPKRR